MEKLKNILLLLSYWHTPWLNSYSTRVKSDINVILPQQNRFNNVLGDDADPGLIHHIGYLKKKKRGLTMENKNLWCCQILLTSVNVIYWTLGYW